jgi:hypothetical protein
MLPSDALAACTDLLEYLFDAELVDDAQALVG